MRSPDQVGDDTRLRNSRIFVIASEAKQSLGILDFALEILEFTLGILEFSVGILEFLNISSVFVISRTGSLATHHTRAYGALRRAGFAKYLTIIRLCKSF